MAQRRTWRLPAVRDALDPGRPAQESPGAGTLPSRLVPTRPLTERVLAVLPGPRWAWILAWALVPWLNLAVVLGTAAADPSTADRAGEVANRAAVSFAILLSLWGAARISDELARLRPALARVVDQDLPDVERLFRGFDSSVVPIALTLAVGVVLPLDEATSGEPVAAAVQGLTWLVIGIPLCTAVWVYATLQLGLHRLGRGRLTLTGYHGDRTLGLQAVGSLAFTGFWMLLGTLTPIAVTSSADLPAVLVTSVVLVAGIGLFFVSLRGLHLQMSAIRRRELDRARELYRQAYQPVREQPSLAVLQQQTPLLNAAESLEKRAEQIQAWPFDEGTFARAVTIASSAVATILARILLAPTGL